MLGAVTAPSLPPDATPDVAAVKLFAVSDGCLGIGRALGVGVKIVGWTGGAPGLHTGITLPGLAAGGLDCPPKMEYENRSVGGRTPLRLL